MSALVNHHALPERIGPDRPHGAAADSSAPAPACPPGREAPATIRIGGLAAIADRSGALWLAQERTLLVADLHLEKGSAFAARGQFLPPYDTRATLAALSEAIGRLAPKRVVALGDSFHDSHAHARLGQEDAAILAGLLKGRDWLWLAGNHDPLPPRGIGGEVAVQAHIGKVRLVHEPTLMDGPEIAGHLHPSARVALRGRSVRRRCFATCGTRLVMPAFGAYAGGLNLRDPAFRPLFPGDFIAHVIGQSRVFAVGRQLLLPD